MSAHLLIEHFHLLAAAPGGVPKLRELILNLAVRGKLVPQDSNDEQASELLKKVRANKEHLIRVGKIRQDKPLPEISDEKRPYELPQKWVWTRLGDIAFSQAGFAFKSSGFNEVSAGLPLIRIRDVGQSNPTTFFDGEYRDEFVVTKGDYLVSMDGDFRVAIWSGPDALLNQRVSRLIFFGTGCAPRFIADSLQQQLTLLQGVKAYTTVDHLSGKQISEALIGLPPAKEQTRIVAKVDELMALCDQLKAQQGNQTEAHARLVSTLLDTLTQSADAAAFADNWARLAEHFDWLFDTPESIVQLKQTILQLAVQGKLVQQDPSAEPASELLKKIRVEKDRLIREGKIKKDKPLPEISQDEKPYELPQGWEWAWAANVTSQITDGTHHTPTYVPTGIPFLSVKDLSSGVMNFSDTRFISPEEHAELTKRCYPERGDLLLTKVGTTGIAVLVDSDVPFSIFVSVALLKLPIKEIGGFLQLLVNSPLVKKQSNEGTEGVGNKNLVLRKISSFVLPIPPLSEQSRIVAKVDELMQVCDALAEKLAASRQLTQKLMETLTEQAAWEK